jgi:aldehyde dehydrogenase (NAD(P)+)
MSDHVRSAADQALSDLEQGEKVWAAADPAARRQALEKLRERVAAFAPEWVAAAVRVKGLPPGSAPAGEEWTMGPYAVLTATATLAESLRALERGRSPVDGYRFGRAPGGRVTVRIMPHGVVDRVLLTGYSAQVWMPPGVDEATVRARAGLAQLRPGVPAGIGVVLGAGNVAAIGLLDVIHELYAAGRVVALKLNPVLDPMLAVFTAVLEPFLQLGVVRIVTGGAETGSALVHDPRVAHVHLTGSAATRDAIVDGPPRLTKEITSELGGVSPTIVLPGRWSAADLRFQAANVVSQRLHNGGYNCVAGQVVVLAADWPQKGAFLAAVRAAMDRAPDRPAYYPGSDQRVAAALEACPEGERLGPGGGRVLLPPAAPEQRRDLLGTEFFAPVLGVVELPGGGDTLGFLEAAVRLADEEVAGTLGVNLIAHPATLRELGPRFETALARLEYGCIAVNTWTGVGFQIPGASWGGFPVDDGERAEPDGTDGPDGPRPRDPRSGLGVVHNALLLDRPERTVVRGPFRPSPATVRYGELPYAPRPPWFVDNRSAAETGRAVTDFVAAPNARRLAAVLAHALRG